MQSLREDLNAFNEQLQLLCDKANTIVPLKQRKMPVTRPLPVQAICAYKKNDVSKIFFKYYFKNLDSQFIIRIVTFNAICLRLDVSRLVSIN